MNANELLFYFLSTLTIVSAWCVVFTDNPLMSALYLVLSMVGISGFFFTLGSPFLGAVQILVYAGAVMVLFVMVLMLIDTKATKQKFSGGTLSLTFKGLATGMFAGLIAATLIKKTEAWAPQFQPAASFSTETISKVLFTKYILAFEILGLVLLVIPIGVVALSRIKGGTHDR